LSQAKLFTVTRREPGRKVSWQRGSFFYTGGMNVRDSLPHVVSRFLLILSHRRTRQALLLLTLLFVLLAGVLWSFFRQAKLRHTLSWLGQQTGQRVEVGRAEFKDYRTIELRDVLVGDFARIDFLELRWSYKGLASREIEEIRIHGVQLFLGKLIEAAGSGKIKGKKPGTPPFKVKLFILGQATLFLDNLGAGLPPLPVRVGEATPLVLKNLRLGGSETDPTANDLQVVLLEDLKFFSPYDPFTPVLGFDQIRLVFSWNGIQNQLLDQLYIGKPTIYVGEDLFLFVDKIKAQRARNPAATPSKPWSISSFEVKNGQIVITSFDTKGITLPFLFSSKPQPIVLDDFSKMQFATEFLFEKTNLNYLEYGLRVKAMEGQMLFSLPLTEQNSNIVLVLKANDIDWKGVTMTEPWVSMTFDKKGLFGEFGGKTYQGYSKGNAKVFLQEGFPWVASGVVTKVDVEPITRLLSPENFLLNGPVTFDFKVQGKSKQVLEFKGTAKLEGPGQMQITAIDDVLKNLPGEWSLTKKDLSEIALKAFRTYDYNSGSCEVSFAPPKSSFQLRLDGKQGQRNIDMQWNDLRDNPGLTY
jgi:hypothetical protein